MLILPFFAWGCAHSRSETKPEKPTETQELQGRVAELQQRIVDLQKKLDDVDGRMGALSDKVSVSAPLPSQTSANVPISKSPIAPSTGVGRKAQSPLSKSDPELGLSQGDAIQQFREALVFFDAAKYPEAILGLSNFLKEYADHSLAPAAQFTLGEAYFQQKEYRVAVEEYQRVLLSYTRSSYVSDSLKRLAECFEKMGRKDDMNRNRQLLMSLFPQSPAAHGLANTPPAVQTSPLDPQPATSAAQAPSNDGPTPLTAPLPDAVPAIEPGTPAVDTVPQGSAG
jgi:TolA-binding protein